MEVRSKERGVNTAAVIGDLVPGYVMVVVRVGIGSLLFESGCGKRGSEKVRGGGGGGGQVHNSQRGNCGKGGRVGR